jgi:tetratricopeptide (TPR) repeat protein
VSPEGARSFEAARRATVRICGPGGDHYGQGLLLNLGEGGIVVLTCHHVVANLSAGDLCIATREADGQYSKPHPVTFDAAHSKPAMDAVVLDAPGVQAGARPLLHTPNAAAYSGTLPRRATAISCWKTDTFDARIGAPTSLRIPVDRPGGWPDPPQNYTLPYAYRLADPTDARPGISGSVATYEDGVVGLAHFSRGGGPDQQREVYLVPLEVWAEGWPALADLIEPLIDSRLRHAAKVKMASALAIGTDIALAGFREDIYIVRPALEQARAAFREKKTAMLIGRPKSGKTRLAWELLREYPQSLAVLPGRPEPPEEFESSTFAGKDVILFFDDLHQAALTFDVPAWRDRFDEITAGRCRLLATSRDGKDWDTVRSAPRLAGWVEAAGEETRLFLSRAQGKGEDLSQQSGLELAAALKIDQEEFERRFDGTPGSLTLNVSAMRDRYQRLSNEEAAGVPMSRLLDCAKLAYTARQPTLRTKLIRAAASRIRGESPLGAELWRRLVRRTVEEGFGEFDQATDEFRTYRPYLEQCVAYEPDLEEIEALAPILEEQRDDAGLIYLSSALNARHSSRAEAVCRAALAVAPSPAAYAFLGYVLQEEPGREAEAEEAYRAQIAAGDGSGWLSLGLLLARLPGRSQDAEQSIRRAIQSDHERLTTRRGQLYQVLSIVLMRQHRDREAEEALRWAISWYAPDSEFMLGNLLSTIPGREREAEEAYRIAVADGQKGALTRLAGLLSLQPDRQAESEQAYRQAMAAGEELATSGLGDLLTDLDRYEEAFAAYQASIAAGEDNERVRRSLARAEHLLRWRDRPGGDWFSTTPELVAAPVTFEAPDGLADMLIGSAPGALSPAVRTLLDRSAREMWEFQGVAPPGTCFRRSQAAGARRYRILLRDVPLVARPLKETNPLEAAMEDLTLQLRLHLAELVGHEEIFQTVEYRVPGAVEELRQAPGMLTDLTLVCRALLFERVPIVPMRAILDGFRELRRKETLLVDIVEHVRLLPEVQKLLLPNRYDYKLIRLDTSIEALIAACIDREADQPILAIPVEQCQEVLSAVRKIVRPLARPADGSEERTVQRIAVVVEDAAIRPYFWRLIELDNPLLQVVSRRELLPERIQEPAATVRLQEVEPL